MEIKGEYNMETQEKVTHTPTPWKLQFNNDLEIVSKTNVPNSYRFIASTDSNLANGITGNVIHPVKGDAENAAFIVRAVNSHEALIRAAQKVIPTLLGYGDIDGANELENAIAQAEKP